MSKIFTLHMIAAVGKNGAIGLNNKLPWHKPDDLRLFSQLTTNRVLIVGKRTFENMPTLFNRLVLVWDKSDPSVYLEKLTSEEGITEAWLCGGAFVYEKFAPYVNGNRLINFIDYDGPYDTVFPFKAYGLNPVG